MNPANAKQTVALIHRFDKDTPIEIIRRQLELTRTFIQPSPDIKIGRIDVPAWKQTEQMMLEQGLISKPVDVEAVLANPLDL